jgi:hypothetical protein
MLEAMAEGRLPREYEYLNDPMEIHARSVAKQMTEMPAGERISNFTYDLIYRSGYDQVTRRLGMLSKTFPGIADIAKNFAKGIKAAVEY